MKKVILATMAGLVALTPLSTAPAAAQGRGHAYDRDHDRGRDDRGQHRGWRKGERFDRRYAQNYREIDYRTYRGRGLYAPPRGYHWVRSGDDAVLIALTSGLIGAVIGGAIR